PGSTVLAALDHGRVPRVVDNDRIETRNVARRLTGGGHGEQNWPFDQTVKKRPDHANGLTAVIERRGEVGPTIPHLTRDLLDFSPRRYEYRHAAALAHDSFYETIVQRSEEHTSELQSRSDLVCRLLLEKKKKK